MLFFTQIGFRVVKKAHEPYVGFFPLFLRVSFSSKQFYYIVSQLDYIYMCDNRQRGRHLTFEHPEQRMGLQTVGVFFYPYVSFSFTNFFLTEM